MARILAFTCTDISLTRHLLKEVPSHAEKVSSSGIGWVQDDRSLLRVQPKPSVVSPLDLLSDVPSRAILAAVNNDDLSRSAADVQPFRFRRWVFASDAIQTKLSFDELYANVPEFLRQNIKGKTREEVIFHLVLAELHQGASLPGVRDHAEKAEAIRAAISDLKSLDPDLHLSALFATDRAIFGVSLGQELHWNSWEGFEVTEEPVFAGHKPSSTKHPTFRALMIANEPIDDWAEVPDSSVFWFDSQWTPKTLSLD